MTRPSRPTRSLSTDDVYATADSPHPPASPRIDDRCLVIGILNVTPDSFSDGGQYCAPDAAIAHGMRMAAAGADYIDVGGESTRPGAGRVPAEEELRRVLPVVAELSRRGVAVSIDTTRAVVASAAIEAGAVLVNDVSGGLADPSMARAVAGAGIPWVLMHWRGHSHDMYARAAYADVVSEVRDELSASVDEALAKGVSPSQLVLDPGLGFAKHPQHDLTLLANLETIIGLGFPVLVGSSRKRFLSAVLAGAGMPSPTMAQRDTATLATSVLAAQAGAWAVRVHDVPATLTALSVVSALSHLRPEPSRSRQLDAAPTAPEGTRRGPLRSAVPMNGTIADARPGAP
jgi:dihydropteroate synthase